MKTTVTLDWQRSTSHQQEAWCRYTPLDNQFIKDNWKQFLMRQKMYCITYQQLGEEFILNIWKELSESGQIYCLRHKTFTLTFLKTLWTNIKPAIKTTIVLHQKLTKLFIQQRWQEIGVQEQKILLQKYTFETSFVESLLPASTQLESIIVRYQPLSIKSITRYWCYQATFDTRHLIIQNPNIPIEFIIDRWKDMTENLRLIALEVCVLPEAFITKQWLALTGNERHKCLRYQKVPTALIERGWHTLLSNDNQTACICHQELSQTLIEQIWSAVTQQDLIMFQQLPKNFLLSVWKSLDSYDKAQAIKRQQCLKELTLEELPRFLTDNDKKVRQWATRQFRKAKTKGAAV